MPDRKATEGTLRCYRCGISLEALSLPLARLDVCPDCGVELHVCRMCRHYAPSEPDACDEEDAIEVRDKTTANFCDYFVPDPGAYAGVQQQTEDAARRQLAALFGEEQAADAPPDVGADSDGSATQDALEQAEKLFRK